MILSHKLRDTVWKHTRSLETVEKHCNDLGIKQPTGLFNVQSVKNK